MAPMAHASSRTVRKKFEPDENVIENESGHVSVFLRIRFHGRTPSKKKSHDTLKRIQESPDAADECTYVRDAEHEPDPKKDRGGIGEKII